MTGLPKITDQARPATTLVSAQNERGEEVPTPIAGEHPLTLFLDKRELVTLMTLGGAPEHLALGYLRNQRLVRSVSDLAAVQVDWDVGAVAVTTRRLADTGVPIWEAAAGDTLTDRLAHRTVTTGCGQGTVFGDLMAEIDTLALDPSMRIRASTLYSVMDLVRRHESIYKVAGAVHGCALCAGPTGDDEPKILRFVEDVGRHNAVDAIAGWDGITAFVEVKRASLRHFGHEAVLRRASAVLQPVLNRCVLISFDLAAVKILRLMTGARIGWVLDQYDADSLREATALAPEFLFCNLERVPATTVQLWPGPWDWAIYEVRDLATARHCAELGAKYVETMAVRSLRAEYDEVASAA